MEIITFTFSVDLAFFGFWEPKISPPSPPTHRKFNPAECSLVRIWSSRVIKKSFRVMPAPNLCKDPQTSPRSSWGSLRSDAFPWREVLREQPPYCIDAHYCDLSGDSAAISIYLLWYLLIYNSKSKKGVRILSFRNWTSFSLRQGRLKDATLFISVKIKTIQQH